jgi:hypothetical protein
MADVVKIDGVDVLAAYGAYPISYEGVFGWPAFKELKTIDWADEDGVEADLSNPKLQPYTFTLPFAIRENWGGFWAFITSAQTHTFRFETLGIEKQLRIVGCSSFEVIGDMGYLTIEVSDDAPMEGYTYEAPKSTIELSHKEGEAYIDNVDVIEYGCVLLAGALDSINKPSNYKEALAVNVSNISGVVFDKEAPVVERSKQVIITLLLRANSTEEFWRNYKALQYDITRPKARDIDVFGELQVCYYNSMAVKYVSAPRFGGDSMWAEISIIFNTMAPPCFLAAEGGELIVDETSQLKIRI